MRLHNGRTMQDVRIARLKERRVELLPPPPKPKPVRYSWHQRFYRWLTWFIDWATLGRVVYWLLKTPTRWLVKRAYSFGTVLLSRRLDDAAIAIRRVICIGNSQHDGCSQCVKKRGHYYCGVCPCFKWRPARVDGWKTTKRGLNCPLGLHPDSVPLGCGSGI